MKKILLIIVMVLLALSCKKEDLIINLPAMSATINESEWTTISRVTRLEGDKFVIAGTSVDGEVLTVTIFGTTTGIYELSLTSATCAAVYTESASNPSLEDTYISVTGEVNLNEVNTSSKKISGTFSFTLLRNLTETMEITNGIFNNLTYTVHDED
ncbi:MAG: hypothetical protein JW894_01395 [Bacteroidales bacterium]|nr:hypothetical protein [Bacteroidales bacterium]